MHPLQIGVKKYINWKRQLPTLVALHRLGSGGLRVRVARITSLPAFALDLSNLPHFFITIKTRDSNGPISVNVLSNEREFWRETTNNRQSFVQVRI